MQNAFFGWLAWAFALLTTVLEITALRTRAPLVSALCGGAGLVQLLITVPGRPAAHRDRRDTAAR